MNNGDLVLYGGVLSDGAHLVCDQQWSSTLGLPLANRSYDWRVQVSEAGEYGVCVCMCVCVCVCVCAYSMGMHTCTLTWHCALMHTMYTPTAMW